MNTIGDLIKTLEHCKNLYPEFEKYNLCMDVAPDDAEVRIFPDWVHDFDYLPVKGTGYIEEFNMIIIEPKYD